MSLAADSAQLISAMIGFAPFGFQGVIPQIIADNRPTSVPHEAQVFLPRRNLHQPRLTGCKEDIVVDKKASTLGLEQEGAWNALLGRFYDYYIIVDLCVSQETGATIPNIDPAIIIFAPVVDAHVVPDRVSKPWWSVRVLE